MKLEGEVTVDDLNKQQDLPDIGWSGSPQHRRYVAAELHGARWGEVEYRAVRGKSGRALSIGLNDRIRHEGDRAAAINPESRA